MSRAGGARMGALEKNRAAWPVLVSVAAAQETISYKQLALEVNRRCGTHIIPRQVGQQALDRIERWCIAQGIPDLTAVVVAEAPHMQGIPGADFFVKNGLDPDASVGVRRHRWSQIRNQVWRHPYSAEPPDGLG